ASWILADSVNASQPQTGGREPFVTPKGLDNAAGGRVLAHPRKATATPFPLPRRGCTAARRALWDPCGGHVPRGTSRFRGRRCAGAAPPTLGGKRAPPPPGGGGGQRGGEKTKKKKPPPPPAPPPKKNLSFSCPLPQPPRR